MHSSEGSKEGFYFQTSLDPFPSRADTITGNSSTLSGPEGAKPACVPSLHWPSHTRHRAPEELGILLG